MEFVDEQHMCRLYEKFILEYYRKENHVYDGTITIARDCFAEPEIHEKLKKMPSGRKKLITKRISVSVDYP